MSILMSTIIAFFVSVPVWAACKGDQNHTAYSVPKMHCQDCVDSITKYFSKQEAVKTASVSLENKCLLLEFKPGSKMTEKQVSDGLESIGYKLGKAN